GAEHRETGRSTGEHEQLTTIERALGTVWATFANLVGHVSSSDTVSTAGARRAGRRATLLTSLSRERSRRQARVCSLRALAKRASWEPREQSLEQVSRFRPITGALGSQGGAEQIVLRRQGRGRRRRRRSRRPPRHDDRRRHRWRSEMRRRTARGPALTAGDANLAHGRPDHDDTFVHDDAGGGPAAAALVRLGKR